MPLLQYPLNLRFKLIALAPRIYVADAGGAERMFIHQKVWKLKEDILVYNNSNKDKVIFRIRADRMLDFSATYRFVQVTDSGEEVMLGAVKRKGMRSIWRATYFVDDPNGNTAFHIKEDNPWTKVFDSLMSEVPILNFFTGYVFNPSYTLYRGSNRDDESQPLVHLKKNKAFFESSYEISLASDQIAQNEELAALLAIMMIVQLERRRG